MGCDWLSTINLFFSTLEVFSCCIANKYFKKLVYACVKRRWNNHIRTVLSTVSWPVCAGCKSFVASYLWAALYSDSVRFPVRKGVLQHVSCGPWKSLKFIGAEVVHIESTLYFFHISSPNFIYASILSLSQHQHFTSWGKHCDGDLCWYMKHSLMCTSLLQFLFFEFQLTGHWKMYELI